MGENWFQRELLNPRRLAFNVFFYGSHLALFAYGWWSQVRTNPAPKVLQSSTSIIGNQSKVGWSQLSEMVGLVISRRWSRSRLRRWPHSPPDASQHHSTYSSPLDLALPRR